MSWRERVVDLTKRDLAWLEVPKRLRAGALFWLSRGAVLEARIRNASLEGGFNDSRHRAVRQALTGLTAEELHWLSHAIDRAARRQDRAEQAAGINHYVKLIVDRHNWGRHDDEPEMDCQKCNPLGWHRAVFGG